MIYQSSISSNSIRHLLDIGKLNTEVRAKPTIQQSAVRVPQIILIEFVGKKNFSFNTKLLVPSLFSYCYFLCAINVENMN